MLISSIRSKQSGQRGWVLFEVMGSCLLLAIVLISLQAQIRSQWDAIRHELNDQKKVQKKSELVMMRWMLQDQMWLFSESMTLKERAANQETHSMSEPPVSRPVCTRCSGKELEQWFKSRY